MPRWLRIAPLVFFAAFYWRGLDTWFYQDDFGWLALRLDVHGWRDLVWALFAPHAHGNMRPWSENGFFLGLSALAGLDPLPFRIVAFATALADLWLIGAVTRRLTRSEWAGFWAQLLWTASSAVAAAACWTSIYNQFLSVFFLLLSLHLLMRGAWAAQWATFVVGLGALETVVMYPAIAAVYALLFARPLLRKLAPMFVVAALYAVLHLWAAPPAPAGPYAVHLDAGLLKTLWVYWSTALGPAAVVLTPAVAVYLACALRKRAWTGLFALAWFILLLAPVLPLRDHVMDYYLVGPAVGVALLGAVAVTSLQRFGRAGAGLAVALYLAGSLAAAWKVAGWHYARSHAVRDLVLGVLEARKAHPGRALLLAGVDNDLFWAGWADAPFRLYGVWDVYLAPGSEAAIRAPEDLIHKYVLPGSIALRELRAGRAAVYEAGRTTLRNATSRYRSLGEALWDQGPPRMVNVGDPLFAAQLGPGWSQPREHMRWTQGRASVRVAGPRKAGERLLLRVYPERLTALGVRAVQMEIGRMVLAGRERVADLTFPLPPEALGKPEIDVEIDAPGLALGFVEVR